MNDITFVISFHYQNEYRFVYLEHSIDYLNEFFPDSEKIVVESDFESKLAQWSTSNPGVKFFFIENECKAGLFNKSKCINKAVSEAGNEKLIILDSDILVHPKDLKACVKELDNSNVVSPYTLQLIDLNIDQSEEALESYKKISYEEFYGIDSQLSRGTHVLCGGIFLTTQKAFNQMGGFPEDIWGWGIEDDFVSLKYEKMVGNIKWMNFKVYHLYHPYSETNADFYALKQKIYDYLKNVDARLFKEKHGSFIALADGNRKLLNPYLSVLLQLGIKL